MIGLDRCVCSGVSRLILKPVLCDDTDGAWCPWRVRYCIRHLFPSINMSFAITHLADEAACLHAGEVHLETVIKDLKERFARIQLQVSPPLVAFRESVFLQSEAPEAIVKPPRVTPSLFDVPLLLLSFVLVPLLLFAVVLVPLLLWLLQPESLEAIVEWLHLTLW